MVEHPERRSSPRQLLEVHIDLHSESHIFSGFSEDLSDGGVFVATYAPKPVGNEVMLEFELPSGHAVRAGGRVAWVREASGDTGPGMGVAFDKLAPADRDAILEFVRQRPPLFYDLDSGAS